MQGMHSRLTVARLTVGFVVFALCVAAEAVAQMEPPSFSPTARADEGGVPLTVKFSGLLRRLDGTPQTGMNGVSFLIYKSAEGGSPLWIETHNVRPDAAGRFTVLLGNLTPGGIPLEIFRLGDARWIEISGSDIALQPRTAIVSVPYALKSSDSETLSGRPLSDFLLVDQLGRTLESRGITVLSSRSDPQSTDSKPAAAPSASAGVANKSGQSMLGQWTAKQSFPGGILLPPLVDQKVRSKALLLQPRNYLNPGSPSLRSYVSGTPPVVADSAALNFQSAFQGPKGLSSGLFQWRAHVQRNSANVLDTTLALSFGADSGVPQPTGFSFNPDGTMNFAPGQQFPAPAVVAALQSSQAVTNSGSSGSTASLNPVVDTYPYFWKQMPSSGTSGLQPGVNTVTLKPCPKGVNGGDAWHYLYVSGTGTPEAVLVTGGTCTSGAVSGTVQFTVQYPHPVGYSISSATDGIQEAIIDAVMPNSSGKISRIVRIGPGNHPLMARLSIRASSVTVTSSGAVLTCNMSDTCIMMGDPSNSNAFNQIVLQGFRVSAGVKNGVWPAVEDNATHSEIHDLGPAAPAVNGGSFGSLVQIDDDQAALVDGVDTNLALWGRCDASFCSTAVVGAGPSGSRNGVLWVKNSNISLQCWGNGIDNRNGNTLHVSDSIVQGYTQFGIRSYGVYGVNPSVQLDNVYQEVGNCNNPLGTGTAGLIVQGGWARTTGGVGPAGKLPQFAQSGSTSFNYYIVVRSSVMGISPPYLAGTANTNGSGSIPVSWNQVGQVGTITYDVLRTVGLGATTPLYGTGNFAVATGVTTAACANKVCSILDDASSTPMPYTVAPATGYAPSLFLWPGALVLTTIKDMANNGGLQPTKYFTDNLTAGAIVNSNGAMQPSVFAQTCNPGSYITPVWLQCLGGNAYSNNNPTVVGTLLQLGASGGGNPGALKGRLIFELPPLSAAGATHIITLADSNPSKTLADRLNRPSWDANDTYIGYDQPTPQDPWKVQLSFGAPISISNYIGNAGDNVNWLERLTRVNKTFKVPVSSPAYYTSSNCISATGACGSAAAGMVTIPVGSSSITVATTAVTAKSEIHIDENTTYGALLGVTCNTEFGRHYQIRSQLSGSGFSIVTDKALTGNPSCLSFMITN